MVTLSRKWDYEVSMVTAWGACFPPLMKRQQISVKTNEWGGKRAHVQEVWDRCGVPEAVEIQLRDKWRSLKGSSLFRVLCRAKAFLFWWRNTLFLEPLKVPQRNSWRTCKCNMWHDEAQLKVWIPEHSMLRGSEVVNEGECAAERVFDRRTFWRNVLIYKASELLTNQPWILYRSTVLLHT